MGWSQSAPTPLPTRLYQRMLTNPNITRLRRAGVLAKNLSGGPYRLLHIHLAIMMKRPYRQCDEPGSVWRALWRRGLLSQGTNKFGCPAFTDRVVQGASAENKCWWRSSRRA